MPTARYNWRTNLSQPRFTPDQLEAQRLRNAASQNKLQLFPLEQEAKSAQLARTQGEEAKARYQLQKEIETDRQKAAFYNGLQELEANLNQQGFGIGTKQHAEAFAAYAHAFPLARSSADVNKTLELHAKVNDDQAALSQRIQTALGAVPQGYQPKDITMTATGQPSIRFANTNQAVPEKVALRYGALTSSITAHLAQADAQARAATQPDQPYAKADELNANVAQANFLRGRYPDLEPVKGLIDSSDGMLIPKAGLTATPVASAPPQATATPTPTATPTAAPAATTTPINHSAALDWANANPNDPRAQTIIERARALATPNPDEGQ